MSQSDDYQAGPAQGAHIEQQGDDWVLVVERRLRHAPAKVWQAITDPQQLRQWAPFDADRSLAQPGTARLSTVGTVEPHVTETEIKRAEAPTLLELGWGDNDLRWHLEALDDGGTLLTLWHSIGRDYIAMGAAGWHICFDVLQHYLGGDPLGRLVGPDAMAHGWPRLHQEYSEQFAATKSDGATENAAPGSSD